MQEAELTELAEQVFTSALVQTYQCDALIDLYDDLQQIWQKLTRANDRRTYHGKLESACQQLRRACQQCVQDNGLVEPELAIIRLIEDQITELEQRAQLS